MKKISLLVLWVVSAQFIFSQVIPPIHCTSAENVCDSIIVLDTMKVAIDTTADEIGPLSCLPQGEIRGTWYSFGINDTGYFRFLITPFDTLNDFDWALFRVDWGNCTDIFSVPEYEVSCDVSGVGGGYYTTGATGLGIQGHQPAIHITSPALFYLYITTSIGDTDAVQGYTVDFSSSDMDLVPCNEIGIEEEVIRFGYLYPNPATDVVYLKLNEMGFYPTRFEIINLEGKQTLVKTGNWNPELGIDISLLPSGIYFYRIMNESGKFNTGKLVIN